MRVLVVNAGSSSVKVGVVEGGDRLGPHADLGAPGADMADRLGEFVEGAGTLDAAGHRIVHGGARFRESVLLDATSRGELAGLAALAPLHNPPALAAVERLEQVCPGLASVACFDTAFHAGMPAEASSYALPAEWVTRWGIRRYGFHGLSCTWAVGRAAQLLGWPANRGRLVVCHLGAGASATAVADGRSVDTTMGFTPMEGLVMATRPGDVDPGVISWLLAHGVRLDELEDALQHRSGLAALSGDAGGDMRVVLERRGAGSGPAGDAVGVYLHRLRGKIAAMAAAMGGLDALVFTGGIGENSTVVRAETCAGLGWLGVAIDEGANDRAAGHDGDISAAGVTVPTVVVRAREDLVIAAECHRLLSTS